MTKAGGSIPGGWSVSPGSSFAPRSTARTRRPVSLAACCAGCRPYPVGSLADAGVDGTCLRAASFMRAGQTAGRGRQDRQKRRARTDPGFRTRPGTDGPEVIGKRETGKSGPGLHMHATLAVSDTGLPPGLLGPGFDPQEILPKAERKRRKTGRRLEGFTDIADAGREVSRRARVIPVSGREADMFEMFDRQRAHSRVAPWCGPGMTGCWSRAGRNCSRSWPAASPMA